jgi:hypothetical protein
MPENEDRSRSTILVADDKEDVLTVVQSILRNERIPGA